MKRLLVVLLLALLAACGPDAAEQNNTANTLQERQQYEEALRAYEAAQVLEPDNPIPYFNAAAALLELDRFDEAIIALQQALRHADENLSARIHYNLGNVHFQAGDYEEAVTAYRESLLLRPDDEDARYNLELALSLLMPPTPTPMEMQVQPEEGQVDPTATPTDNPAGDDGPTPTPPPEDSPPDPTPQHVEGIIGDMSAPTPEGTPLPQDEGSIGLEETNRLLEGIAESQRTFQEFQQQMITPGAPSSGKDW